MFSDTRIPVQAIMEKNSKMVRYHMSISLSVITQTDKQTSNGPTEISRIINNYVINRQNLIIGDIQGKQKCNLYGYSHYTMTDPYLYQ